MVPITDCLKSKISVDSYHHQGFQGSEDIDDWSPCYASPKFSKVFEVICNISGLAISGVLSQENNLIAYFNEKLNDSRQRYSTYDKKFYVVVQTLRYWRHYLLPQKFMMYSDYETLKYLNSQKKANYETRQMGEIL